MFLVLPLVAPQTCFPQNAVIRLINGQKASSWELSNCAANLRTTQNRLDALHSCISMGTYQRTWFSVPWITTRRLSGIWNICSPSAAETSRLRQHRPLRLTEGQRPPLRIVPHREPWDDTAALEGTRQGQVPAVRGLRALGGASAVRWVRLRRGHEGCCGRQVSRGAVPSK